MEKERRCSWKRVALIILCVVLALILAVMVTVTVWADKSFRKIRRLDASQETWTQQEIEAASEPTDPIIPGFTGPVLKPEEVEWGTGEPAPEIGHEDEIVNILLIGQDRRPGESRARSDAMILCTFNLDKKTLVLTSFQRDTYVQYPEGYRDQKLNAAYQWGGMPMLNETLELNFGIHVDGNFEVDFNRFMNVIDLAGGVDINLTNAEVEYMINHGHWVSPGLQHLDGEEALTYARIRKIDNDFGRTNRQRKVIQSLLQSCKSSSPQTLLNLMDAALPMLATDMTDQEIVALVMDILPILKDLKVTSQQIPAKGTYQSGYVDGHYVLLMDLEANRAVLQETLLGK